MRSTWFSARALRLHAMLLLVVAGCLVLGWWQFTRAIGGNGLSWVYTFEWPFFAAYAIYMWWKLLHEPLHETRAPDIEAAREREEAGRALAEAPLQERSLSERVDELGFDPYDEADPELAAYNRYLASLHQADPVAARRQSARSRRAGRP